MMVQGPRLPFPCCRRETGAAFPPVPLQSTGSNQPEEAEQDFLPFTPAPLETLTTWAGPVGTAASGLWEGDLAGLLGPPGFPWDPGVPGLGIPSTYVCTCCAHTGTTQGVDERSPQASPHSQRGREKEGCLLLLFDPPGTLSLPFIKRKQVTEERSFGVGRLGSYT